MEVMIRKKSKRMPLGLKILIWLIGIIVVLAIGIIVSLNIYINDYSIPVAMTLIPKDQPKNLMVIFPHPDDEVTVAGTLHKLKKEKDMKLTLVYLTRGEAGPTGGLVPQEELGQKRTEETEEAAKILGVDHLEMFDYPDGGIKDVDSEVIKKTIRDMIEKYKPTTIITYDDKVGLYGHLDHLLTGRYVYEVFQEDSDNENFPVKRLYFTTLSQDMINTALKISTTFKERYPKDPEMGLPKATVAIKMASEANSKMSVIKTHKTQWQVMGDLQPMYDKLPAWIYYRIFDKEYYALVGER